MKRIIYSLLVSLLGIIACNKVNDEPIVQERHKCKLNLELFVDTYDLNTKSSGNNLVWENGTKLFLNFSNSGNPITGVAEYDVSDDSWELSYTGNLNLADKEQVSVYFFTAYNANDSQDVITLTPESAIYSDTDGIYSFLDDGELRVMAHLTPAVGRVRFKGNVKDNVTIKGVLTYQSFNIRSQAFLENDEYIEISINDDYYTSYIYGIIGGVDRELLIYNDFRGYMKCCDTQIMEKGKSGYIQIPTLENHEGWSMVLSPEIKTLTPQLSTDYYPNSSFNKSDLRGWLLSCGDSNALEYGFVYGTDQNYLNRKVVFHDMQKNFSHSIRAWGDSTYFYQTFTISEHGYTWGNVVSFIPQSDKPEVDTRYSNSGTIHYPSYDYWECQISGEVLDVNNSHILDYGFQIEISTDYGYSDEYHISLVDGIKTLECSQAERTPILDSIWPFHYIVCIPVYASDPLNRKPILTFKAYARNQKGVSYGQERICKRWSM